MVDYRKPSLTEDESHILDRREENMVRYGLMAANLGWMKKQRRLWNEMMQEGWDYRGAVLGAAVKARASRGATLRGTPTHNEQVVRGPIEGIPGPREVDAWASLPHVAMGRRLRSQPRPN